MREPISLDMAEYKSGLAMSLYNVILEKASTECPDELHDLICIVCDINEEINHALKAALGMEDVK